MVRNAEGLTLSAGEKFLPSGKDMNSDSTQPSMESKKGESRGRSFTGLLALGVFAYLDE